MYRHGRRTKESEALRRELRALLKACDETLDQID
jgi:hypothetical protein